MAVGAHKENNADAWRRTRTISYLLYCANHDGKSRKVGIYEFMPLYGDPTEEEIKQIEEQEILKEEKRLDDVFKFYRDRGMLN